ncbi:MAG: GDP-mannose 4,6-dehydratase, partial [Candidatus Korobacteraceae bacterium]
GGYEMRNLEVAKLILAALGRSEALIQFVSDRKGHDLRYAINCEKLERELGWQPAIGFEQGLAETIAWYRENVSWLDDVRTGQYRDYFQKHYVQREKTFAP